MSPSAGTDYQIAARIERLPLSIWHLKILVPIGTGWFFDAFDALSIAYVLPVLIGLWNLKQADIGELIAVGYIGQVIGSILLRLARRAYRPCAMHDLHSDPVLGHELRLRVRLGSPVVGGDAVCPGYRPGRRNSDHGILYRRVRRVETAWAVCAWLPDAVYDRSLVRRLGRRLRGSESGLAVDVHYRSAAGGNSVAVALAAAGITRAGSRAAAARKRPIRFSAKSRPRYPRGARGRCRPSRPMCLR